MVIGTRVAKHIKKLFVLLQQYKSFFVNPLVICIVLGAFGYLLSVSWLKWGDIFLDTGRELWIPLQLMEGRVLYKDLFYEYGFFAPYFIALLYKLFGVTYLTAAGCGMGITLIVSLFLYKISRYYLNTVLSTFTVLTFLFVFAFGYYAPSSNIFNFIIPYSFASTFFAMFTCMAFYFFIAFIH